MALRSKDTIQYSKEMSPRWSIIVIPYCVIRQQFLSGLTTWIKDSQNMKWYGFFRGSGQCTEGLYTSSVPSSLSGPWTPICHYAWLLHEISAILEGGLYIMMEQACLQTSEMSVIYCVLYPYLLQLGHLMNTFFIDFHYSAVNSRFENDLRWSSVICVIILITFL